MPFKPRIFISSLLADKIAIRKNIESFFKTVGAEVYLYEKNLTPSTAINTYRQDILDSDFVIFILDEKYGTKTDSGISGTEEEFLIAEQNKLKLHVYIKKLKNDATIDSEENSFLDRIKKMGISYYEYLDDSALLKRIKETVMQISREVVLNDLSSKSVSRSVCRRIAAEHDYQCAIDYIALYNRTVEVVNKIGLTEYDTLIALWSSMTSRVFDNKDIFIDTKYYELLLKAMSVVNEMNTKMAVDFSCGSRQMNVYVPVLGDVTLSNNKSNPYEKFDVMWYQSAWKEFKQAFDVFVKYVENKKIYLDTLTID